jgi:hypothetical protein
MRFRTFSKINQKQELININNKNHEKVSTSNRHPLHSFDGVLFVRNVHLFDTDFVGIYFCETIASDVIFLYLCFPMSSEEIIEAVGQFGHIVTKINGWYYNGYGTITEHDKNSLWFTDNHDQPFIVKISETTFKPQQFRNYAKGKN